MMTDTYRVRHATNYSWDIEDHATVEDALDRDYLVQSVVRELQQDRPPRVIGVYGWWGAGKSHVLSMIIRRLLHENDRSRRPVVVAAYKAWRYEMEANLAAGLIRAMADFTAMRDYPIEVSPEANERIRRTAARMLKLVKELGGGFGLPGNVAQLLSAAALEFTDLDDDKSDSQDLQESSVDRIQREIQLLVDEILSAAKEADPQNRQHRFVVFIDDLDRCSPANMVRMFEWLKVHLSVDNCTYVLGLDHEAAARAIVGHYREYIEESEDLAYGLRYLEKLVDSDYELGASASAERMAIARFYGDDERLAGEQPKTLGALTHKLLGGYFPGENQINQLLQLYFFHPPRTMLKIVNRYKRAMDRISQPDAQQLRLDVGASYPFWTLLMIAMYYRLEPEHLSRFVEGRGYIFRLFDDHQSVDPSEWRDEDKLIREFCQFAYRISSRTTKAFVMPKVEALQDLRRVVLENRIRHRS